MKYFMIGIMAAGTMMTGCASLGVNKNVKTDFDCPTQEGFGCRSIASIRSMIVQGGSAPAPVYNYTGAAAGTEVSVSGVPKWTSDVVLKVHVGNYIDAHGDYHDDSVMYVVARHGGWEVEQ